VYPPLVTRQRLGKKCYRGNKYTRNNRRIVGRVVFFTIRVVSRKSMLLVLPRTSCLIWGYIWLGLKNYFVEEYEEYYIFFTYLLTLGVEEISSLELIFIQLVAFYRTQRLIAVVTTTHQWSVSWGGLITPTSTHYIFIVNCYFALQSILRYSKWHLLFNVSYQNCSGLHNSVWWEMWSSSLCGVLCPPDNLQLQWDHFLLLLLLLFFFFFFFFFFSLD
jgi:hypothetical protein